MSKPDEEEIIRIFQNSFGKKSKFLAEDVERFTLNKIPIVAKSDMLVESTDVPPGMKIDQIARKSMVACVSDFACKGVKPQYATISLSLPQGLSRSKIKRLAAGFARASKEFVVKIVGGDVNEGKEIVINVSMFGWAKKIVARRGAKVNDVIITSGPFSYSHAGLKIILRHFKAESKFERKSKKSVFLPTPKLNFGLSIANYISSAMDSSDGLAITLNEMSRQSANKFVITKLPTTSEIETFAKKNRIRLADLVFCGGEEYEIVATVPRSNFSKVMNLARKQNIPIQEIGYVAKGKNVVYLDRDKIKTVKKCGWRHFKS
ncbi:MAG: thiamine-phosphate kinase [Thaumarchaeota archaeon]|nr:thiamine-phosphate kinase [Nitrososphaerota archaeon]